MTKSVVVAAPRGYCAGVDRAVVTVEKNRHGEDHVELEFRKDFAHGRFVPEGGLVQERLIEERVFTT